jgi:hypothetical protein
LRLVPLPDAGASPLFGFVPQSIFDETFLPSPPEGELAMPSAAGARHFASSSSALAAYDPHRDIYLPVPPDPADPNADAEAQSQTIARCEAALSDALATALSARASAAPMPGATRPYAHPETCAKAFRYQELERAFHWPCEPFPYVFEGWRIMVPPFKKPSVQKVIGSLRARLALPIGDARRAVGPSLGRAQRGIVRERPPWVSLVTMARDALGRLVDGHATRQDISEFVAQSAFVSPDAVAAAAAIGSALDRLKAAKASVYELRTRLWHRASPAATAIDLREK